VTQISLRLLMLVFVRTTDLIGTPQREIGRNARVGHPMAPYEPRKAQAEPYGMRSRNLELFQNKNVPLPLACGVGDARYAFLDYSSGSPLLASDFRSINENI
jgi:hypothetical protein